MTDPTTAIDTTRLRELLRAASSFRSQSMRTAALGVLRKEAAKALPALLDQLAAQAAEIERLKEAMRYEQERANDAARGSLRYREAVNADRDKAEARVAELEEARAALRKIAEHVGAGVGAECSHRFHLLVEDEVRLVVAQLRGTRDKAEARVEKLEALLLAVKCGEFSGITCDNVNGRCWFDARDAALAKREGGR